MEVKVSVVMTAYNAEKYLSEAIQSVLDQTLTDFEFIIANDGSTDNSLTIMQEFQKQDERIIIDDHENMGMAESVNRILKFAKSDLIARMDADDIMKKDRLMVQTKFLNDHPEISMASCITELIGDKGNPIGVQDFPQMYDLQTKDDTERYVREKKCIHFAHTGTIFRKDVVIEVGGYIGKYWPSDDLELFNRVADKGYGVVIIPEILMKYRLHGSSIITSKFYNSVIKSYWVEDCILKKRLGKPELTFEEYEKEINSSSFYERLKNYTVIYANNCFRNAGIELSNKRYFRFLKLILIAIMLRPGNITGRILTKLKRAVK
jgi:glycosyltransferase involved in cell wall biosynthesis